MPRDLSVSAIDHGPSPTESDLDQCEQEKSVDPLACSSRIDGSGVSSKCSILFDQCNFISVKDVNVATQSVEPLPSGRNRKMWRVCVYCDALFTTNQHGSEGADATIRLAEEYPRACIAPGTCDDCLEDILEVRCADKMYEHDANASLPAEGGKQSANADSKNFQLQDEMSCTVLHENQQMKSKSRRRRKVAQSAKSSTQPQKSGHAVNSSNQFDVLKYIS